MGDPNQWKNILRTQLRVTEAEFWRAVREGIPPSRQDLEEEEDSASSTRVPGWLVDRLLHTVHMSEEKLRTLSPAEAEEAWEDFCSRPKES